MCIEDNLKRPKLLFLITNGLAKFELFAGTVVYN